MVTDEKTKLKESIHALEHALTFLKQAEQDPFYLSGIIKNFEVCLEYAWKYLGARVADEGVEANSPKEIIKHAGRLDLIDDVKLWLDFMKTRNLAVHDYLGVKDPNLITIIRSFFVEAKKIVP